MPASLVPTLLAIAMRAAENGTLIEIAETLARLVRLVAPLIPAKPDAPSGS